MTDFASQTVAQLKDLLKEKGLPVDGKKADLVQRLTENSAGNEESAPELKSEPEPAPQATNGETNETKTESVNGEGEGEKPSATEEAGENKKEEEKPEKPKPLTAEERKQLAVDLLTKKIQRAEKFGDESSAEAARKDLNRVEKFGVEPGTALAKEIGLVDRSFNQGLKPKLFKKNFKNKFNKKKNFKPNFKNFNKRR